MSTAVKLKPQSPGPVSRSAPAHNNRILVVEDEREIARLYKEMLGAGPSGVTAIRSSRSGGASQVKGMSEAVGNEFSITVAHNAEEALAQVKHSLQKGQPFAMGFFDVLLGPGMDGIELVKTIHQLDPKMYAVFVTAYQDRSVDAIRGFLNASQPSHWDYLSKPFNSGEILQKARNFISLWNLSAEKEFRDLQLADAHRRLLDHERAVSVSAVARGVSHEFGNLLMQIMGKADLGRRKNESDMRDSLERILEASQRAATILERFKHLSTPAEVRQPKGWVQIPDLIDEAIDLMEAALRKGNVKACKIKMDSCRVMGHGTSLLQVLVNLIINAIHAMPAGGQIDFSVTAISDGCELRVRDYGPGIKRELLEKVLEPFFTTKGEQGTGLGLAISREIIEIEHRGEFKLQNHPAKGLEVVIRLPTQFPEEGV